MNQIFFTCFISSVKNASCGGWCRLGLLQSSPFIALKSLSWFICALFWPIFYLFSCRMSELSMELHSLLGSYFPWIFFLTGQSVLCQFHWGVPNLFLTVFTMLCIHEVFIISVCHEGKIQPKVTIDDVFLSAGKLYTSQTQSTELKGRGCAINIADWRYQSRSRHQWLVWFLLQFASYTAPD